MESPDAISPTHDAGSRVAVVRGARACTVCRAAKMKCVGAEDGQQQCQRCRRANVECVFEKHRRGRKPGSKLSEASKMLRRLEKGLNSAKLKSQAVEQPYADGRDAYRGEYPPSELPPLNLHPDYAGQPRPMDLDDDDDEADPESRDGLYPAKLIRRENQRTRNSFFRTILNPAESSANPAVSPTRASPPRGYPDPISAGIIDEENCKVLFDLIFLRLNPFINLFDPALHTVSYVRSRCPLLFTTLVMAGCKFFKPEFFKQCQKLAHELAVRAFAESWKRVEVVQAFAVLTYWKDPDDNRTWTYIGYACRMAVELGLNRYVASPPPNESEFQLLERRNRERTYLVLFIHDRSLSTQTGRSWMLPEDELVRHASVWHEQGGNSPPRPEDVIVAAFVQLRRIAAETTDMFYTKSGPQNGTHNDVNYEVLLRSCNAKLTQWMETWHAEMQRAGGETFHFSFLSIFRLYLRLFLNSFGISDSMSPSSRTSPSLQALSACCTSALDSLRIVSKEFPSMSMLRYGQETITVMSAYSAVFLLKLLRNPNTAAQLHEGTAHEIHTLISKTADAYYDASVLSPASSAAAYHSRFLRSLLANDTFTPQNGTEGYDATVPIDPRLQSASIYPAQSPHDEQQQQQAYAYAAQTNMPQGEYAPDPSRNGSHITVSYPANAFMPTVHHASELDAKYWREMLSAIGFGAGEYAASNAEHHLPYHAAYGH